MYTEKELIDAYPGAGLQFLSANFREDWECLIDIAEHWGSDGLHSVYSFIIDRGTWATTWYSYDGIHFYRRFEENL